MLSKLNYNQGMAVYRPMVPHLPPRSARLDPRPRGEADPPPARRPSPCPRSCPRRPRAAAHAAAARAPRRADCGTARPDKGVNKN